MSVFGWRLEVKYSHVGPLGRFAVMTDLLKSKTYDIKREKVRKFIHFE